MHVCFMFKTCFIVYTATALPLTNCKKRNFLKHCIGMTCKVTRKEIVNNLGTLFSDLWFEYLYFTNGIDFFLLFLG